MKIKRVVLMVVLIAGGFLTFAQQGTKERIKIHSTALEGNLAGDPADREVTVYLPPSYKTEQNKRFPVLYMLHGYTDTDNQWFGWVDHWINLHEVIDKALASGESREMIVVMPNAYNTFKGSMYSSSVTIGDWETFVTGELVDYIDQHYRTLANRESRGLAGHSMGGYGTIRLGMKYPEVYCAIYMLSACCMEGEVNTNPESLKILREINTREKLANASFGASATMASAAAWAPNPENPPFFLDLPSPDDGGANNIAAKFHANRILYMIDQYIPNLKKMKAIGLDAGTQDRGIHESTRKLHARLDSYRIPHEYESYEGDHLNRIAERIEIKVLPFFSANLEFE